MYFLDDQPHGIPHIHARYAEYETSIRIDSGEKLAGDLPRKQLRLVQAWIEIHQDELNADWDLAVAGEMPYKIDPLWGSHALGCKKVRPLDEYQIYVELEDGQKGIFDLKPYLDHGCSGDFGIRSISPQWA